MARQTTTSELGTPHLDRPPGSGAGTPNPQDQGIEATSPSDGLARRRDRVRFSGGGHRARAEAVGGFGNRSAPDRDRASNHPPDRDHTSRAGDPRAPSDVRVRGRDLRIVIDGNDTMLGMLTSRAGSRTRPNRFAGPAMQRHDFRSMGMDIAVLAPSAADEQQDGDFLRAAGAVERVFEEMDARFSRFRQDSELSMVNERAGHRQTVSQRFAELLEMSLSAARSTDGLFDPTVLPALIAAGYDRDYDELIATTPVVRTPPAPSARWREVVLEERSLFLPKGVALDFGGIAKGWAADVAADRIGS